jgi:putative Mg2+ transporter-C (MgtC) family protein
MELWTIVLRLSIALLCGAVVGLEREISEKAAGLRTHILVCMGACLFGLLGISLAEAGGNADLLRLAQGLLIGIGFLGAGVIVREGSSVRGLTTAAGIWVMGAIGLAIGVGRYQIGLVGTLFCLLTITLFSKIDTILEKVNKKRKE